MDRESVIALINEKETALDHSGIKGQKWGVRRYQNEDGSLTPEGRRRYGLKSEYSGMSDQELQKAINRKRTENQYIDLRTSKLKKKQQERSDLVREAIKVGRQTVDISTTIAGEYYKYDASKTSDPKTAEVDKELAETSKQIRDLTGQSQGAITDISSRSLKKLSTREIQDAVKKAKEEIKDFDDAELRKHVNRLLLEQQYEDLVNPPKPSKTRRGIEVFQTIGAIMAPIALGLGIAIKIKDLIHKEVIDMKDEALIHYSMIGQDFLCHYGIKGQRRGIRRYQNEDGTLTPEGYRHYGINPETGRSDQNTNLAQLEKYKRDVYRSEYKENRANKLSKSESKNKARQSTIDAIETHYGEKGLAAQKIFKMEKADRVITYIANKPKNRDNAYLGRKTLQHLFNKYKKLDSIKTKEEKQRRKEERVNNIEKRNNIALKYSNKALDVYRKDQENQQKYNEIQDRQNDPRYRNDNMQRVKDTIELNKMPETIYSREQRYEEEKRRRNRNRL